MINEISIKDFNLEDGIYTYRQNMGAGKYVSEDRGFPKEIVICLELCLNGFDVGLYNGGLWLMRKKLCTNEQGYENDILGILPRKKETWEHAIKLANKLLRQQKGVDMMYKLKGGENYEYV